jgi:hypothetical protein
MTELKQLLISWIWYAPSRRFIRALLQGPDLDSGLAGIGPNDDLVAKKGSRCAL